MLLEVLKPHHSVPQAFCCVLIQKPKGTGKQLLQGELLRENHTVVFEASAAILAGESSKWATL